MAVRAQIEPGLPEPAHGKRFKNMARIEDAQSRAVDVTSPVRRNVRDLVNEPARTRLADPAGTKIIALRLRAAYRDQGRIYESVDPARGAHGPRAAVNEARCVVEVDEVHT